MAFAGFFCWPAQAGSLLLWEVTGGAAPVWLYGSIHVCRPECFPLPEAVAARFSKAAVLVVEIDATRPDVGDALLRDSPGRGCLKAVLSKAEWKRLLRQLEPLQMPETALESLSPTLANLMVSLAVAGQAGLSPAYGTDLYFIAQAQRGGKRLVELETVAQQLKALNAGSPREALSSLRSTMKAANDGSLKTMLEELVSAWQAGDAKRLSEVLSKTEEADPASARWFKELFERRNRRMSESIAGLAREGEPVFVVVGGGHLVGRNSIPELLMRKGFKVRQLSSSEEAEQLETVGQGRMTGE
ncbi:MAG: TraB/GumN family protein [Betaproteobacteria bacterium]|nr:TraB/GumN family protein [Betaproteobacteria bacterium]